MGRGARAAAACAGLLVTCVAAQARAHTVGLSTGSYVARGARVDVELTFSRTEVAATMPGLLAPQGVTGAQNATGAQDAATQGATGAQNATQPATGAQDSTEAARALETIEKDVTIEGDGHTCAPSPPSVTEAAGDAIEVRLSYACPSPPARLHLHFGLLDALAPDHRHVAHLAIDASGASGPPGPDGDTRQDVGETAGEDDVLHGAHRDLEVTAAHPEPTGSRVAAWLQMGVEHILTGYDHLVFLFGLVLVGGRWRSLVGAVSAFTVAHSITLALAALGVWSPPPRLVEAAIAASIVWVGVEDLVIPDARGRWRLTFPFGLVHGFGFASALREVALPRAQVPLALVSFNVGVEVGQLAVMAVVVPALAVARAKGWMGPRTTKALAIGVTLAGGVWLARRVLG